MDIQIDEFRTKVLAVKDHLKEQLDELLKYFKDQFSQIEAKMFDKIDAFSSKIEENIAFHAAMEDSNAMKNHFGSMLFDQLKQEVSVLSFHEAQQQSQSLSMQNPSTTSLSFSTFESETAQTKQLQQLREVHQILKKAIFLFSEQYTGAISGIPSHIPKLSQVSLEFQNDLIFTQDRCHANLIPPIFGIQNNNQAEEPNKLLTCEFEREINLASESPQFLLPQYRYTQVKCFAVLEDNRRAVLCTRNNILLVDLITQRVIKSSELRGFIAMLPTCIQPLYSYEYKPVVLKDMDTEESELTSKIQSNSIAEQSCFENAEKKIDLSEAEFAKQLMCKEPTSEPMKIFSAFASKSTHEKIKMKRVRRQNLVAVGMGNLSTEIDICVYSLKTLERVMRLPGHTRTICKMLQAPLDYSYLFSISSDRKIIVWNITDGQPIQTENTLHTQSINEAALISEKELVTYSLNGEVFIWDIVYNEEQLALLNRNHPHFTGQKKLVFPNLQKRHSILRSCLSLYVGQALSCGYRCYFSVTSLGIAQQKYFLEMNNYSNQVLAKTELPHKVLGLNVLMLYHVAYVVVTYQNQNYFEVYVVDTVLAEPTPKLLQRVSFIEPKSQISNVIENPRVQFVKTRNQVNQEDQISLFMALDEHINQYTFKVGNAVVIPEIACEEIETVEEISENPSIKIKATFIN